MDPQSIPSFRPSIHTICQPFINTAMKTLLLLIAKQALPILGFAEAKTDSLYPDSLYHPYPSNPPDIESLSPTELIQKVKEFQRDKII